MRGRKFVWATAFCMGVAVCGTAQVAQFSASGSYLKGTGDNNASMWGGGISGKGFIGQNIALGAALHTYPKKTFSQSMENGFKYTEADLMTNLAATADVLLGKKTSTVQPYLGVDAGASFNNHTVSYTNQNAQYIENENSKTYFLLGPKAGVNIGLGQAFGIFAQAQYNFTFGNGNSISINDVPNPFTTEPVSQFFTVDAGIYFRLMPAK